MQVAGSEPAVEKGDFAFGSEIDLPGQRRNYDAAEAKPVGKVGDAGAGLTADLGSAVAAVFVVVKHKVAGCGCIDMIDRGRTYFHSGLG